MLSNFCKGTQLVNREVPGLAARFPQAPKAISSLVNWNLMSLLLLTFKYSSQFKVKDTLRYLKQSATVCQSEREGKRDNLQVIVLIFKILLPFIFWFRF